MAFNTQRKKRKRDLEVFLEKCLVVHPTQEDGFFAVFLDIGDESDCSDGCFNLSGKLHVFPATGDPKDKDDFCPEFSVLDADESWGTRTEAEEVLARIKKTILKTVVERSGCVG